MSKSLYGRLLRCGVVLSLLVAAIISTAFAKEAETQYSSIVKDIQLKRLENEPKPQMIDVFDVRDDGWFVVGLNTQEICVYDQDGIYQYGFKININGLFAVELCAENIVIYLVRGSKAIQLDKDGTCVSCTDIAPEYITRILNRSTKYISDNTYMLERDVGLFRGDYARLVKISQTDGRTVLYDASSNGLVVGIWHYIVAIGIIICFIFGGMSIFKKKLRH